MATEVWNSNPQWPYDEDISEYLDVPDYYLVGYEEVRGFLRGLHNARIDSAGTSAGGRDLTVLYYGPKNPERTLCVAAGTHATEVEGVAAVVNTIRVLDAGSDLRGEKWRRLQNVAKRVGFYLMPFYNPDAAARNPVKSCVDMPVEVALRLQAGFWKNGKTLQHKRVFGPWSEGSDLFGRLDNIASLGCRYNDAGADINRPMSGTKTNAVETRRMLEFLKANRIDCFMDMHSDNKPLWLGMPRPEQYFGDHERHARLQQLTGKMIRRAGGPEVALFVGTAYRGGGANSWSNNRFFAHNLGMYSFIYEEKVGWRGNFPADKPREEIWLENTYNGMYTIVGLAQALLEVPTPWE